MTTIVFLLCLLATSAHAGTFRLTAEFLYPNNAVRPVNELPTLLLTPGNPSESKYTSDDELLETTRNHTLKACLKKAQDQTYDLSFDYEEYAKERGGSIKTFTHHFTFNLSPGKDQVIPIDLIDPMKGIFKVKIVKISNE